MTGRNNLCLCGSGKESKECCALKSETFSDEIVEEEISRIVKGYYENAMSDPADVARLERCEREWVKTLGNMMSLKDIKMAAADYFLYIKRRDLWKRYMMKTLNGSVQSATRTVLEAWKNPSVLFGKVTAIEEDYFLVDEALGHQTYCIALEPKMQVEENLLVFGVVLPDRRHRENGIHLLGGLTFIYDQNGKFAQEIELMAEASGQDSSYAFFKEHMVDIHKAILEREVNNVNDLARRNLTPLQQEVITRLEVELNNHIFPEEVLKLIEMTALTYLVKEQPAFRKPGIIAAAVFKAAYDMGVLEGYQYTQNAIGDLFGVSIASMQKHTDKILQFSGAMSEVVMDSEEHNPLFDYTIGTDPWPTERADWDIYYKLEDKDFTSFQECKAYIEATINEPFKPTGKKQRAQAMAYDAYGAAGEEERLRLAKKAYVIDPKNVDAILLQAKIKGTDKEAERFYLQAIRLGKQEFDYHPQTSWGLVTNRPYMRAVFSYGVWLFEQSRYINAVECFNELLSLNPGDEQGALYLAMASYIHAGDYNSATRLSELFIAFIFDEAIYLYLKWLSVLKETGGKSKETVELFEGAEEANRFVKHLIDADAPKYAYPRHQEIIPGSMEEALYIRFLL